MARGRLYANISCRGFVKKKRQRGGVHYSNYKRYKPMAMHDYH